MKSRYSSIVSSVWQAALAAAVFAAATSPVVAAQFSDQANSKIRAAVRQAWDESDVPLKVWVYFTHKGIDSPEAYALAVEALEQEYHPRALERRRLRRTAPGVGASPSNRLLDAWLPYGRHV